MYALEGQSPIGNIRPLRHNYKLAYFVVTAEYSTKMSSNISSIPTRQPQHPKNQKTQFEQQNPMATIFYRSSLRKKNPDEAYRSTDSATLERHLTNLYFHQTIQSSIHLNNPPQNKVSHRGSIDI